MDNIDTLFILCSLTSLVWLFLLAPNQKKNGNESEFLEPVISSDIPEHQQVPEFLEPVISSDIPEHQQVPEYPEPVLFDAPSKWFRIKRFFRERKIGSYNSKDRVMQKLNISFLDRRIYVGGAVVRIASIYRIKVDGEQETATWVSEPINQKNYWLAGSPLDNPQIEGYLSGRRALPHLQSNSIH